MPDHLTTNMLKTIFQAFFLAIFSLSAALADLKKDRQHFLDAETAIKKNDLATWHKLDPLLNHYPLYADLRFKLALKTIHKVHSDEARATLDELKNTPLRKTYLKSWLKQLARKKRWQAYLDFYQPDLGTTYECHHAEALYNTNQPNKALPIIKKLWLVGKSQIKSCDPAFKKFRQSGQLTADLVWQRIELAIGKGKTPLVKYLKRLLPSKEQKLANEWLRIRSSPSTALDNKYTQSADPRRQKMLVYGIKRMALFEADKALAKWKNIRRKVRLDDTDKQEIERYLALRMTTQRLPGATEQHLVISNPDKKILPWGVRAALLEGNWNVVDSLIDKMGNIDNLSDRWMYWKAKSSKQLGDHVTSDAIYHLLASHRGYHNFLASDYLSLPYRINHHPLNYKAHDLEPLLQDYNVRRTYEFYQLGRLPKARHEWYYLIKNHGDEDRQKLAYILKQWGWHSLAILTIARTDYDNDLSIRFPTLYKDALKKETRRSGLDTAWVMALMRQESAFQPDARSPSGARGLMQLMPGTGRHVARLLKRRRPKIRELYQPELNIKLGTHYLKTNMEKYAGHQLLTTAAYNAGPHRVDKWLPDQQTLAADIWVETIPFKETRGYVQRIMSYAPIYDQKLGNRIIRLKERMKPVQP